MSSWRVFLVSVCYDLALTLLQTQPHEALGFLYTWSLVLDLLQARRPSRCVRYVWVLLTLHLQNSDLRSKLGQFLRLNRLVSRFLGFLFLFINLTPSAAPASLQKEPMEVMAAMRPDWQSLAVRPHALSAALQWLTGPRRTPAPWSTSALCASCPRWCVPGGPTTATAAPPSRLKSTWRFAAFVLVV